MLPRFRSQVVDTGLLSPLVADFSGVRSVAADKLDTLGRQMSYQLVYELEALEGLGSALVEPFGGMRSRLLYPHQDHTGFFSTGGIADNILTESFTIGLCKKPRLAFDTEPPEGFIYATWEACRVPSLKGRWHRAKSTGAPMTRQESEMLIVP
ncbi:MAG: hypothetical protein ABIJ86_17355 [Spirochaetota bacterium]